MATLGLSYTDEPSLSLLSLSLRCCSLWTPQTANGGERAPHARNITTIAYLQSARSSGGMCSNCQISVLVYEQI